MKFKEYVPYLIALLCAGFACTQDVFVVVVDWLSSLSMKLNYGWFTAITIVLLAVWGGYILKTNWRRYKYTDAFTATLVFYVVTTLYFRFIDDGYEFVTLVWKFAYVDVLWIFATAFIVEAFANKNTRKAEVEEKESAILLDSPIETPKEDQFDYYSEALHIANTLSQLPENKAVSVAVLSPWGYGKTSFVNLIKYAISHGDKDKPLFEHVIVEFNPRQSKDVASIQEDFFKALTEAIPDEARFRRKIGNYLENIGLQDLHPIAKIFAGVIKGTKEDATNEVNEVLDSLGKRLIVFIDDFDRLTDVEIIEVLKLIDKNAAFRHTIFITAYDESAVSNALNKYESEKGIAYIDKFFTLRFHLPLRSQVNVVNAMYQQLKDKVDSSIELLPIMNKRFWIVAECVRSLRDVKNFCNMFLIDYVFNSKHKINFEEYFLLELMKFRYYDDYCNLFRKAYVGNQSLFQDANALYTLKAEYSPGKNGEEPKGELPRSINILRCIFAEHKSLDDYGCSSQKPSFRSVQYVRYFDMYFTNRGYGHVQAEGLESLFSMQTDEEIDRFYRQCIQQKAQSDIVDYLTNQDWQDIALVGTLTKEETFKQFVRLVFLYSAIVDDNDMYVHSLQLQLLYEPNFTKGYNGMEKQAYYDWVLNVIYGHDNTDYIPLAFLMKITHTLISPNSGDENGDGGFILNADEVKQKNFELFKKYIGSQQEYSLRLSSFYRLCLDHVDDSHLMMMEEANEVMREFLYKDKSNEYLNGFLVINKDNGPYVSIAFKDVFFKQIFPVNDEGDAFEKFVKDTLPEGDVNRAEILAYLKRYRKAGSDHTGYFYMKHDNPNPSNMEIIEGLQF